MGSPAVSSRRFLQWAGQLAGVLALGACGADEPAPSPGLVEVAIVICQDVCRTIDPVRAPAGASVIDAMAAAEETGAMSVRWNGAGALAFVTSIDGVEAPSDGRYWLYWVDGAFACVGPGDFILEADARVEWRLTEDGGSCI